MREEQQIPEVRELYNAIADSMEKAAGLMQGWKPARQAVRDLLGVEWSTLSHAVRTQIGSVLRDRFRRDYSFTLTPTRLQTKTSNKGSHMIALYPPEWLAKQIVFLRESVSAAIVVR